MLFYVHPIVHITQIGRNIEMPVNCNICSDLLGFNMIYNLLHIKTHGYIATAPVWLPAKFSGIIAGLNILKDINIT